jgi:hypothetical protein
MTKKLSLTYLLCWVILGRSDKQSESEEKVDLKKGGEMRKIIKRLRFACLSLLFIGFFAVQDAFAEEGSCYLKAANQDVFVIVYDLDRDGNQGAQLWQGRINQNESVKITVPHGRFRYAYNAQPDVDQPLSGGDDRWCNNLNTVLVP